MAKWLIASVLVVVVSLVDFVVRSWPADRDGHLRLVDVAGQPIRAALRVEAFVYDPSPAGPSPTASLGELAFDDGGELRVPAERIGEGLLLRFDTTEHGIGYAFVAPGGVTTDVELGRPIAIHGTVGGPEGGPAIPAARVLVFAGGPRGVLLAETTSAADGSFGFDRIAEAVHDLTFRVFAAGHGVGELETQPGPDPVRIELLPTAPGRGRLLVGGDGAPSVADLEVRMFQLPGLTARTAADGSFEVSNLPPPPTRGYVVVPELPAGFTYRRTAVVAGESADVNIVAEHVVRGRVLSSYSGLPLAGAIVHHDHGPNGVESVTTDADGRFELRRVPLGPVAIHAHALIDRRLLPRAALAERAPTARVMIQAAEQFVVLPDRPLDELTLTLR